jgi:hypothetical protein
VGKIIYYDFRKPERDKEMREIQMRIATRLANSDGYNTPEAQAEARKDNIRFWFLKAEEAQMQKLLELNKEEDENETN